ncbi:MAG: peptidyl-prolyl cis-trans isomerase [Myxococcaceae bacterium]|nr:peptidyl-prolyl cis-trans isomerase [Myxococcaceae bacterium]
MRSPLLLAVLAVACSNRVPEGTVPVRLTPAPSPGPTVVSFNGGAFAAADLEKRFANMSPYARARYQTVEQRKEFVEALMRYEVLAREAVKRGLADDPEVVDAFKKAMVQKIIRQEFEEKKPPVPEADVKAYYEKHQSDYVKPAMTRLSHVFFTTENKAKAEGALKAALKLELLDYAAFAKLARENSQEPRTQPIEGDMRFLSDEELTTQYGPELAAAAKELTKVGEVLPRLVETKAGYHVIKLQGRQVALDLTLDQVKQNIESILTNERKMERYKTQLGELFKQYGVTVNDAVVAQLKVDMQGGPGTMGPGGAPPFLPPSPDAPVPPARPEH